MKSIFLLILPLALVSCFMSTPLVESIDVPVKSWEFVDTEPLNLTIEKAIKEKFSWPTSPTLIVYKLLDGDTETRELKLTRKADRAEAPDEAIVVLIRDGFLDDSVRGDWHQIKFKRMTDNTWRFAEIRRASRCWRKGNNVFESGLCP